MKPPSSYSLDRVPQPRINHARLRKCDKLSLVVIGGRVRTPRGKSRKARSVGVACIPAAYLARLCRDHGANS